jgi:ribosome biogenesis GTPase
VTVETGEIIAAFGRRFLVETARAGTLSCITRGRHLDLACGDRVSVAPGGADSGVIEGLLPRSSLLRRAVEHRAKLLAANATQVAVVVAAEPSWSDELVCRVLAAAEHERLKALVILSKNDLEEAEAASARLDPIRHAGYRVVRLSALQAGAPLEPELRGECTVLVGQSGMGKSTLINARVPGVAAATSAISHFLDSGRHTTTAGRLYRLDASSALIDTPGLKEFGLAYMSPADIEAGFVELRAYSGGCRFADCSHRSEPDCALRAALAGGAIHPRRFELMQRIAAAEGSRRAGARNP